VKVPFFRPEIDEAEIEEVVQCLRSGWLTSGPRSKRFEDEFKEAVGSKHALAVNSCTSALHLAVEALGLKEGQAVLVPTWTFAATAEVVRYQGGIPILVDCDPGTFQFSFEDAHRKLESLRAGNLPGFDSELEVVGMIPVHVGGAMIDLDKMSSFAKAHNLWVVEDAAHAFPASWRANADSPWRRCGENTSSVSCYWFYANKTMTTGEGGMAVTDDDALADRMKLMCLHGLSHDAWARYSGGRSWDYRIVAPGFKYNLTDIQAAVGIHQLARAEEMRTKRERVANKYLEAFKSQSFFECPETSVDRIDSWHLFPIRLQLEKLSIDRGDFIDALKDSGVGCSVHYRPLHLHPYYSESKFSWKEDQFANASALWPRVISLPIFSAQTDDEIEYVVKVILSLGEKHGR